MATFLFTYRVPRKPLTEVLAGMDESARADRMAAWNDWFGGMGASVLDQGQPVNDTRTVGTTADTRVGGYSLMTAADFDAAMALAQGCPGVEWGGGVEVGEFIELGGQTRPIGAGQTEADTR